MFKGCRYLRDPVTQNLCTIYLPGHKIAGHQGRARLTTRKGDQFCVESLWNLVQVHNPVLTPAGSGSGYQPIAPQQYFLMGGVPGAKLHHVLGTGTGGKHHTGESFIGGSLNELRRMRRANNSDSVAKGTGGTCNIEQHDLAAAHITIIGCNIQFLRHDLEPFCLNLPSNL